jgi:CRISPR-associated endonuclease/helicase Cas3
MKYYAHSLETDPTPENWQELKIHLRNVADLAASFAEHAQPIRVEDSRARLQWKKAFHETARLAGLLHDLGKYRREFQQYLRRERGRSTETAHSVYGAAAMGCRFNDLLSAFAIAGHHSGLHDQSDLSQLMTGSKFRAQELFAKLLCLAQEELGPLPEVDVLCVGDTAEDQRHHEFTTRMLLSMVVDADRLDSERWEREQELDMPWHRAVIRLDPEELLRKLLKARECEAQGHPKDDLNGLRNSIVAACLHKGESSPQGFFSLTVPTGGGKTLSSMAFALAHVRRHGLRRVIVVLPYLSIIEQNARKYRDVFGQEYVLEHHSAVETRESPRPGDADEPAEASDMEKAMENWDAPIIVTTSVQFLETLFAAAPGRARKLHNVGRSVVIFDEVQT